VIARRSRRGIEAVAVLSAFLAVVAAPTVTRADGVSGQVEPRFTHSDVSSTDDAGATLDSKNDAFIQRYRLNWERALSPQFRLSAGGVLDDIRTWNLSEISMYGRTTTTGLFADVRWGGPVLGGVARYDRQQLVSRGAQTPRVNETYNLSTSWRPEDGPRTSLILSRSDRFDPTRRLEDRTTYDALLSVGYKPVEQVSLDFSTRYSNLRDRLAATELQDLRQSARVSWLDRFLDRRLTTSASYSIHATRSQSFSAGAGTREEQVFPIAALSAVETFPATTARITLAPNPGLANGDVTAPAGLNIGYGPTQSGDRAPRHAGLQLTERTTRVNALHVYVNLTLPAELEGVLGWEVYRSNDNLSWESVPLTQVPVFDPFANRYDLRFAETQAQYVKVVTRPLPSGLTIDETFSNVFVTELEAALVSDVEGGTSVSTRSGGALNAATSYRMLASRALVYDSSAFVTHAEDLLDPAWSLTNALSWGRPLTPKLRFGTRVQRTDADQRAGHEDHLLYSATLTADLLATVQTSAGYAGQLSNTNDGRTITNSFTALARAELYEGADVAGNATYSLGSFNGQRTTSTTGNAAVSLEPHRRLTTSFGYGYAQTYVAGFTMPATHRVDATASWNPLGTLNLNGGVVRLISGARPNTSANVGVSWAPFPGGALQLSLGANRTLETASQETRQSFTSALRWRIRPRAVFDLSYLYSDTSAEVRAATTRSWSAGLVIGF
jgi:hypothetical protein